MKNVFFPYVMLLLVLCSCCVLSGCQSKYKLAPVSGTVTLDGEPLEDAVILFNPSEGKEPGPGSAAKTDAQGHFKLSLAVPGRDVFAAVAGKHDVVIQTYSENGERMTMEVKTTFEVPPKGTNAADFHLPLQ